MASPNNSDQHEKKQSPSDQPSVAEETASTAMSHYQHPFPFTIVPNCFIDDYLPHLSATAQSVMLVFYRLTLGWHRAQTFISQKELRQRTGIASYTTLNTALKELLTVGLITVSDQRGQRRLQGYCLTPAALSATESGALPNAQPPHHAQNLHIAPDHPLSSATESVEEPLQKMKRYHYRNRSGSTAESVVLTSPQLAQGKVPDKPKERLKKSKETSKEIVRYERYQNETQKASEEHTNALSPAAFLTRLLEQHALPPASGKAASPQRIERLNAQDAVASDQPNSPLEANTSTPTTLPVQQASVPNAAAESTRPHQPEQRLPASEDATELAARRQRLLALQQALAQLKRTPSLQLLARQRIPRLEEAIKHLIASLAESA